MREDKLGDLSMELSVEILQLVKELRARRENVISGQIGRSATSICANIAESKYAHGRADFIAKLMEFWKLLALYISSNTLSSVPWAIPFGEEQIQVMVNQAKDVLSWYDDMKNPVPTWYKGVIGK